MKKHSYLLKHDKKDDRDKAYKKRFTLFKGLPESVDLSNNMPPIVDQGTLGSCTANAIAGALGFLEISSKIEFEPLSRLFIYYNERCMEDTINEDAGAEIRDGIKSLVKYGACSEYLWPYDIREFTARPSICAYADAENHKVTLYRRVICARDIKVALAEGYPVVIGVDVFNGFETEETTKSGIVPMPTDNEESLGGHAILVVGYDDTKNWFIIRNSWGLQAGDKGHYYLDYKYVEKYASDMWVIYNQGKVGRFLKTVAGIVKSHVRALPKVVKKHTR